MRHKAGILAAFDGPYTRSEGIVGVVSPAIGPTIATFRPALLLVLVLSPAASRAALTFEEGVARDPSSQAELYREQHWVRSEGGRTLERLVLYRCPDGIAFGRKQVDYRHSTVAPEFRFQDQRSGYLEGLARRGATPTVFFRPGAGAAEKSMGLPSPQLVADAGFDEFVRRQWLPLVAGKAVPLDFAVPSRLESLGFTARRVGEATVGGERAYIFRLRLGGLLGYVVPSIDVYYGQQSRRLLRFQGLSNLRGDDGRNPLNARIDFASQPRAADEAQWQASLAAPLAACRTGR